MHIDERSIGVPAALRPWISDVTLSMITAPSGERTLVEAPDHATALAMRIFPDEPSDLVVMGPRTRASYHTGKPGPFCVRARIQPGRAGLLLGRSIKGLVGGVVPLSRLWGQPGDQLTRTLSEVDTDRPANVAQLLLERSQEVLVERLSAQAPDLRTRSDLVHRAGLLLTGADGNGPEGVAAVGARLHVSERHLRNLFTAAVGVSPRHFARLARLRTVLAQAGNASGARLATEAGYYDQSHMTAEFRQLMGIPVGAYVGARLPAASPCGNTP